VSSTVNCKTAFSTSPVLVYDDACGFCSRSVQFVLRHKRRHDLLFVARDSELGKELRSAYKLKSVESMIWIENDQAFAESVAAMKVADYLGGRWSHLANIAALFPPAVRNRLYRIVAKNRRRLPISCPIPTPNERALFLS
jgi:predicted DCC family thiol-disulfide oxidoreductase YuxK